MIVVEEVVVNGNEVLYYNGWIEPGAYYLIAGAEGQSPQEAVQSNLDRITTEVRKIFGLDPEDADDEKIQGTLYLLPSDGLIPVRTILGQL